MYIKKKTIEWKKKEFLFICSVSRLLFEWFVGEITRKSTENLIENRISNTNIVCQKWEKGEHFRWVLFLSFAISVAAKQTKQEMVFMPISWNDPKLIIKGIEIWQANSVINWTSFAMTFRQ